MFEDRSLQSSHATALSRARAKSAPPMLALHAPAPVLAAASSDALAVAAAPPRFAWPSCMFAINSHNCSDARAANPLCDVATAVQKSGLDSDERYPLPDRTLAAKAKALAGGIRRHRHFNKLEKDFKARCGYAPPCDAFPPEVTYPGQCSGGCCLSTTAASDRDMHLRMRQALQACVGRFGIGTGCTLNKTDARIIRIQS